MVEGDHFDTATTEEGRVRLWAAQKPDANVGLCPDKNWCFLETDDEVALRTACADIPAEVWDTTRVPCPLKRRVKDRVIQQPEDPSAHSELPRGSIC
jgi:hypothetical protein